MNCVAFNPKNPFLLASCSDDGLVKLWKGDRMHMQYKEMKNHE